MFEFLKKIRLKTHLESEDENSESEQSKKEYHGFEPLQNKYENCDDFIKGCIQYCIDNHDWYINKGGLLELSAYYDLMIDYIKVHFNIVYSKENLNNYIQSYARQLLYDEYQRLENDFEKNLPQICYRMANRYINENGNVNKLVSCGLSIHKKQCAVLRSFSEAAGFSGVIVFKDYEQENFHDRMYQPVHINNINRILKNISEIELKNTLYSMLIDELFDNYHNIFIKYEGKYGGRIWQYMEWYLLRYEAANVFSREFLKQLSGVETLQNSSYEDIVKYYCLNWKKRPLNDYNIGLLSNYIYYKKLHHCEALDFWKISMSLHDYAEYYVKEKEKEKEKVLHTDVSAVEQTQTVETDKPKETAPIEELTLQEEEKPEVSENSENTFKDEEKERLFEQQLNDEELNMQRKRLVDCLLTYFLKEMKARRCESVKPPENIPEIIIENENVSSEYESQEINYSGFLQTQSDKNEKLQKFAEMRSVTAKSREEKFYIQAEMMKDFEDDYSEREIFLEFRPTYDDMNNEQLRTYFTWRTNVRNGKFEKIDNSYVYIYLCELINGISLCEGKEELFKYIISFFTEYCKKAKTIGYDLLNIVKDFYIVYALKIPINLIKDMLPKSEKYFFDLQIGEERQESFIQRIIKISGYDFTESKFYPTQYGYLVDGAIEYVFDNVADCVLQEKYNLRDILLLRPLYCPEGRIWVPFNGYIFYDKYMQENMFVALPNREMHYTKNRKRYIGWGSCGHNVITNYIIKLIENEIRKYTGYKYKLRPDLKNGNIYYINCWYDGHEEIRKLGQESYRVGFEELKNEEKKAEIKDKILSLVRDFLIQNKIPYSGGAKKCTENNTKTVQSPKENIEFHFDKSKLDSIRKEAEKTQRILITDEERQSDEKVLSENRTVISTPQKEMLVQNDNQTNEYSILFNTLNDIERDILRAVIMGGNSISEIQSNKNIMLETVYESINEKSLEIISDNIIETNDNVPYVYEDYIEELRKVFEEEV